MITPATRAVLLMASLATCYQLTIPSSILKNDRRYPERTSISLSASRERTRLDRSRNSGRGRLENNHYGGDRRRENADIDEAEQYDAFGDYYDTFEDLEDGYTDSQFDSAHQIELTPPEEKASTFYSRKSIADPSYSADPHFQHLCTSAGITRPSRIQSLAWPVLSRGENAIVADQTGSGKTFAYLLPLLQRLYEDDKDDSVSQLKKKRTGTPRILVLTPTAELADQIHAVCTSLSATIGDDGWNFNPFVTTATGSQNTNIREFICNFKISPGLILSLLYS